MSDTYRNDTDSLRAKIDEQERVIERMTSTILELREKRSDGWSKAFANWAKGIGSLIFGATPFAIIVGFAVVVGFAIYSCESDRSCYIQRSNIKDAPGFALMQRRRGKSSIDVTIGVFPTVDDAIEAARTVGCSNYKSKEK